LSWFPTWFPGCQDAVEGGFESGEKGLVSQGASGSFVALELWLEIVGGGLPEESPPVFHHGQKRSDLDQPVIEPGQVSGRRKGVRMIFRIIYPDTFYDLAAAYGWNHWRETMGC